MIDLAAVRAIVQAGVLAPSGDNCQPWRFHWDGAWLRVRFVRERAESFYDVENAASWVSLGAVLCNMRIAAASLGLGLEVTEFPDGEDADTVARCRLVPGEPGEATLAPAIEARCVNRRPYAVRRIPRIVRQQLLDAARNEDGIHLTWVDGPRLQRAARLAAVNDRILFEHPGLHAGLFRWLRWNASEVRRLRDGMPVESLELNPFERLGFRALASPVVLRLASASWLTRALPFRARRTYQRSGAIVLLSSTRSRPIDFVRGGEVLERLWLMATLGRLAFQPITGVTFLLLRAAMASAEGLGPTHRRLLERCRDEATRVFPRLRNEAPIVLARLGYAATPSARSPRLPADSMLDAGPARGCQAVRLSVPSG
jgi:nitroreductase